MNKNLKELRENKKLSQADMAEALGVSTVAYHLYETGQRRIPSEKADQIANLLGVKAEEIFLPSSFSLR